MSDKFTVGKVVFAPPIDPKADADAARLLGPRFAAGVSAVLQATECPRHDCQALRAEVERLNAELEKLREAQRADAK